MLNILQINTNRCKVAQDLLLQQELEIQVAISIIAEPYRIPEDSTWYSNKYKTAAIHWNPKIIEETGILVYEGWHSVAVKWREITIVSSYISPNVDMNEFDYMIEELDEILKISNSNIIFGGDYNAWSSLWGSAHTNRRGDKMEHWAATNDIRIINNGRQPTCVRPQGSSIVDLTWSTADVNCRIFDWRVLETDTSSDHLYICYSISKKNPVFRKKKYIRWRYKKLNVESFCETLEWNCSGNIQVDSASEAAKWLQDTLIDACDVSMPRAKQAKREAMYWWSDTIAELRSKCTKARKE